jgi:hypothetical protein
MLEEYGSRGPPADVVRTARRPIMRYFENGDPIAIKLFGSFQAPSTPFLVKYGRKQFLEPMLTEGRIRVCPASFYNNPSHLASVQDDEIPRSFFIPTYKERLAGKSALDFKGHNIAFGDDDIVLPVVSRDYYLFSLCDHIYYRMPTDFDADAALIIRDPRARWGRRQSSPEGPSACLRYPSGAGSSRPTKISSTRLAMPSYCKIGLRFRE